MVVCRSNAADYESVNRIAHGCGIYPANGKRLKVLPMVIPCQAAKAEGVTTIEMTPTKKSRGAEQSRVGIFPKCEGAVIR